MPAELEAVHGEQRHFLVGELELDRHALVDVVRHDVALDAGDVVLVQQADRHETRETGIHLLPGADLLAHEFELIGRLVVGEHDAVAVENEPAARRDRLDAHAIALRKLGVIVVAQDLQIEQACGDGQQERGDDRSGDDAADREDASFAPMVLDAYAPDQSSRLRRRQRSCRRLKMPTTNGQSNAPTTGASQRPIDVTG